MDDEELRMLLAALSLHDVNKYVNEKYGWDKDENDAEVLEKYFEDDDFGIREFLKDGDYFDDLLYLIQRTEVKENSVDSRGTTTEFRHLVPYCRKGDGAASEILNEGIQSGAEYLERKYSAFDGNHVHLLEFTAVEQPILNDLLVASVKSYIAGEADEVGAKGVVMGSTSDAVLYLGEQIDLEEIESSIEEILGKELKDNHPDAFSCELTWNKFEYDVLEEVGIPFEEKKDIISETFTKLFLSGPSDVEAFENIPEGFKEYFPYLGKSIYLEKQKEFGDEEVQRIYDDAYESIEGNASTKSQKVKVEFISRLIESYPQHEEFLEDLKTTTESELQEDLVPESDVVSEVVDRFLGKQKDTDIAPKEDMCFLCANKADRRYSKGQSAVYRTYWFSRRVKPHQDYKRICEVCNLEYALINNVCDKFDVTLPSRYNNVDQVEVAYFYWDNFVSDVRLQSDIAGDMIQGDTIALDEVQASLSLWLPQYQLQPFQVNGRNHRLSLIRKIFERVHDSGMKVVIGKPFSRFETSSYVFEDEEAIRPEEVLGIDKVERYEDLSRPIALFDLMATVGAEADLNNPYLELDRDELHSIADFVVVNHESNQPMRNTSKFRKATEYLETYHGDKFMEMKQVAQKGMNLFGKQFDSKYKKTKVFRECLDSFLSGMSQGMDDDVLLEHVSGQVYDASKREDYAGQVEYDETVEFVESVREYLQENELYDLKRMSDWENALVNTYYFTYDQLLYGDNNEN